MSLYVLQTYVLAISIMPVLGKVPSGHGPWQNFCSSCN